MTSSMALPPLARLTLDRIPRPSRARRILFFSRSKRKTRVPHHFVRGFLENGHDVLDGPVLSFAIPTARWASAVQRAGYRFGLSTSRGPRRPGDDWYRLRRIRIGSGKSRFDFWKRTSGYYHRYRALLGRG